ncbi:MAG TPA: hypothetical protein VIM53_04670 [Candidatus Saccharimonadales bacterium]
MQKRLSDEGFSVVEALITIVVLALIAGCGWLAWRHTHDKKTPASSTKTASSQSKPSSTSSTRSNIATTTDPYAGWKTYCDATYKYCFKYPSNWTVQDTTAASKAGDEGGIDLLSPDQTVQVVYSNAYAKDSSVVGFFATKLLALSSAGQNLTLVGGYIPSSGDNGLAGNNIPIYEIVDDSLLNAHPLTVNQQGQFPTNAQFTDQYSADSGFNGSFLARPAVTIQTVTGSEAWLSSANAQTAIQILESLAYTPSAN